MNISSKRFRASPRWLNAALLTLAVGFMPVEVAVAQDYDAVERRLGAGVAEGELTLKQAVVMMEALRRAGQQEKRKGIARENYARAEAKLKKEVADGKTSGERARARLLEIRKQMAGRGGRGRLLRDLEPLRRGAGAPVERREPTREPVARNPEGLPRRTEVRDRGDARRADPKVRNEGFEARVKAAVKAGRMTEVEAEKTLDLFRKRQGQREERDAESRDPRTEYAGIERRIKAAVAAGRMKEEEAERTLEELRQRLRERARDVRADEGTEDPDARRDPETRRSPLTREP